MKPSTSRPRLSDKAVIPLSTLDPTDSLDDLEWLDQAIGDSRVVAIGESSHYNREFYQLQHRLLRYLVERHGFGGYAMESSFTEGRIVDDWVRGDRHAIGDAHQLSHAMVNGMTSLMGLWTEMRSQLEWMRVHNLTGSRPVHFYGVDLPGSSVSLLPGLDAAITYLTEADPDFQPDPSIQETASAFAAASSFSAPAALAAYGGLPPERKDALTAGLAGLAARMTARRLEYIQRTSTEAYERSRHSLNLTVALDAMLREMSRGNPQGFGFNVRDVSMSDTVQWILQREDRIVVAAHNGHIQRWPITLPGAPPATTMGMQLAERLGSDYVVIGTTSSTGQTLNTGADFYTGTLFADMGAPQSGSLDALMAESDRGPFATDLRRLSSSDADAVRTASQQRFSSFYSDINPLEAFDIIVHLPHVTAAEADQAALASAPRDVQEAFSGWKPQ